MQGLFAPLPTCVRIKQTLYPLHADAATALRILAAFEDESLTLFEQQGILLHLLYEDIPSDTAEAVRLGLLFLNCGDTLPAAPTDLGRLYSFTIDAPLIYAAMQRSHGVDVFEKPLHWYRFVALFCDLDENSFFARLLYLRRGQKLGTLTPQERRAAAALGESMRLPPQARSPEETEFMRLLGTPQKEEFT